MIDKITPLGPGLYEKSGWHIQVTKFVVVSKSYTKIKVQLSINEFSLPGITTQLRLVKVIAPAFSNVMITVS